MDTNLDDVKKRAGKLLEKFWECRKKTQPEQLFMILKMIAELELRIEQLEQKGH